MASVLAWLTRTQLTVHHQQRRAVIAALFMEIEDFIDEAIAGQLETVN